MQVVVNSASRSQQQKRQPRWHVGIYGHHLYDDDAEQKAEIGMWLADDWLAEEYPPEEYFHDRDWDDHDVDWGETR